MSETSASYSDEVQPCLISGLAKNLRKAIDREIGRPVRQRHYRDVVTFRLLRRECHRSPHTAASSSRPAPPSFNAGWIVSSRRIHRETSCDGPRSLDSTALNHSLKFNLAVAVRV